MAMPTTPLVTWAYEDVNLPVTGKPNKSKPIPDLLRKGYDKGQKPACEEFNYILNMNTAWTAWIVNEKIPEVEASIDRKINELEVRINAQLDVIRQSINALRTDINALRTYVDQQIASVRQDIASVRQDVTNLRLDMNNKFTEVNAKIDALNPFLVPVGAIMIWHGGAAPQGWLECNGQVYNTSQNPKLFSVLGRNSVPDYRGLFLRGWAHGSGTYDPDYNRGIGSIQDQSFQSHSHEISYGYNGDGGNGKDNAPPYMRFPDNGEQSRRSTYAAGGNETRPKNVAVMYIIKTDQATSSGGTAPSNIIVSPDTITNKVGYSVQATATVLPSNIASQYPVTWASQNTGVATVNGSGVITLVGPGETNVVASISTGMAVFIKITSYSVLTSLSVSNPSPMEVNTAAQLAVTKTPSGATEPLQFLTSNAGIAAVNSSGYVTAVAVGNATITVRGTLSGVSTAVNVQVIAAPVDTSLQDVRLGVEQQTPHNGDNYDTPVRAPAGCVITGMMSIGLGLNYGYYKAIQKKVNGVWVTIEG